MLQMNILEAYQISLNVFHIFNTLVCGAHEEFMHGFIIPEVSSIILM